MAKIDNMVEEFLAQKKIAVVGVSDKRDTGCNLNYRKFKETGYQVYGVNPRISEFEGDPCYSDLKSIPEKPDAVFIEFAVNDAHLPYDISLDRSKTNLNAMIDQVLAANPACEVVLLTMNAVTGDGAATRSE